MCFETSPPGGTCDGIGHVTIVQQLRSRGLVVGPIGTASFDVKRFHLVAVVAANILLFKGEEWEQGRQPETQLKREEEPADTMILLKMRPQRANISGCAAGAIASTRGLDGCAHNFLNEIVTDRFFWVF